jgi:hypothetical protein
MSAYKADRATAAAEKIVERLRCQMADASVALATSADGALPSLRPLHDLQSWCDLVFTETELDSAITVVFFLDHILEEAFENLAGDVRYDQEADAIRRGFFGRLGVSLGDLAKSDLMNPSSWHTIAQHVLVDYTDVLAQLNRHQLAQLNVPEEGP